MYAIRDLEKEEASLLSCTEASAALALASEDESEGDSEWFPGGEEEEDEPLEYCSDDDYEPDDEHSPMDTDVVMEDRDEEAEDDEILTPNQIRDFWLDNTTYSKEALRSLISERDGLFDITANCPSWYRGVPYNTMGRALRLQHDKTVDECFPVDKHALQRDLSRVQMLPRKFDGRTLEHVAGPKCRCKDGYSGYEISAEEMRGCQTVQCLVRKGTEFEDLTVTSDPERDDEDFELRGRFILTGLSDHMPSRDSSVPKFTPGRHSCNRAHAENGFWIEESLHEYAMPFHPTCLEVYKHASKLVTGKVDINALTSWWSLEADYHLFNSFPRDPNVNRCHEQEWQHNRGTAYLVANPLYIPKLKNIFNSAIETNPDFDPQNPVFTSHASASEHHAQDPFSILPHELILEIIDNLPFQDFASLCSASRTFLNLPNLFYQKRLHHDMPWLWEAWPTTQTPTQTKYSIWAALTPSNAAEVTGKPDRDIAAARDYVAIVKKELPELAQHMDEALPAHIDAIEKTYIRETVNGEDCIPFFLPPDRTNYFKVYMRIARHWNELLGLRNRARIWKDCEVIIQRAEAHRRNGRFDENGITESLVDVMYGNEAAEERRVEEEKRVRDEHMNKGYPSLQWV